MSYVTQGIIGLVLGILFVFFILGILLIIFSIIMLAYGLGEMTAGTQPGRCGTWGHDWRPQLPGLPRGTTCRNCLVRKDGAFLAWRGSPMGIPHFFDPAIGAFVPHNAPAYARKRGANGMYLVDDPRLPFVQFAGGRPAGVPPALAAPPAPIAVEVREGAGKGP